MKRFSGQKLSEKYLLCFILVVSDRQNGENVAILRQIEHNFHLFADATILWEHKMCAECDFFFFFHNMNYKNYFDYVSYALKKFYCEKYYAFACTKILSEIKTFFFFFQKIIYLLLFATKKFFYFPYTPHIFLAHSITLLDLNN